MDMDDFNQTGHKKYFYNTKIKTFLGWYMLIKAKVISCNNFPSDSNSILDDV